VIKELFINLVVFDIFQLGEFIQLRLVVRLPATIIKSLLILVSMSTVSVLNHKCNQKYMHGLISFVDNRDYKISNHRSNMPS
jgi:hypothetical protein